MFLLLCYLHNQNSGSRKAADKSRRRVAENGNKSRQKKFNIMSSLMLNGIGFITGDPTLKLNYPQVTHPGLQITTNAITQFKWIYLMLPLTKGSSITGLAITYNNSNARSFITQTRLVNQTSPDSALVVHDDATQLTATTVTTHTSTVSGVTVTGSIVLMLRLNFTNVADTIEIGSVEVDYQ